MELLSVILALLITSSDLLMSSSLNICVTPNKTVRCSDDEVSCLALQEYASQSDIYFINDTILHFEPGIHTLKSSLNLKNLHNFTFHGVPGNESVNVLFGSLVSITWEKCSNIEISLISFTLLDKFTISIVFEHTQLVQLSSISVFGNGCIGNSSIMSRNNTVGVRDSTFIGIQGSLGAALMILGLCVIFTGNNAFLDNSAPYGGSIYIFESVVTLSGTNTFINNRSPAKENFDSLEDDEDDWLRGSGGAMHCKLSTLNINSEYSIFPITWQKNQVEHY